MKISKKIWMRILTLIAVIGLTGIGFLCEWYLSDLFKVTYDGRTFIEMQAYMIAKVTPAVWITATAISEILGAEVLYRIYTFDEKEVMST